MGWLVNWEFYVYLCVACMYVCVHVCLVPEEGVSQIPLAGVTGVMWLLGTELGPLEGQQVLLTTAPLAPPPCLESGSFTASARLTGLHIPGVLLCLPPTPAGITGDGWPCLCGC